MIKKNMIKKDMINDIVPGDAQLKAPQRLATEATEVSKRLPREQEYAFNLKVYNLKVYIII